LNGPDTEVSIEDGQSQTVDIPTVGGVETVEIQGENAFDSEIEITVEMGGATIGTKTWTGFSHQTKTFDTDDVSGSQMTFTANVVTASDNTDKWRISDLDDEYDYVSATGSPQDIVISDDDGSSVNLGEGGSAPFDLSTTSSSIDTSHTGLGSIDLSLP
jgi:hypothetical protein